MPHGVIFDMDGVLVDSGPAHHQSWQLLARRNGLGMSDAAFAETFGMTSREIIRKFWGAQVADAEARRIDDEKEALYRDLIRGHVPLSPGARETLAALAQAGLVLAVGTSGPPENLELVLRETGLAGYFAATVTGFDVQRGKPAPDVFLLAAARAGLQPVDCVVVEDAPVGIQAAVAGGMQAIGYAGTHAAERLTEAGAARVVSRLTEITAALVEELLRQSR